MLRTPTFTALLALATPATADAMQCSGSHPNWNADLNGEIATFQLRDRVQEYDVKLTTPAINDPDTTAYTLIGPADTAILIVHPGRCNTAENIAHILTQDRSEAILLTGCCRILPE